MRIAVSTFESGSYCANVTESQNSDSKGVPGDFCSSEIGPSCTWPGGWHCSHVLDGLLLTAMFSCPGVYHHHCKRDSRVPVLCIADVLTCPFAPRATWNCKSARNQWSDHILNILAHLPRGANDRVNYKYPDGLTTLYVILTVIGGKSSHHGNSLRLARVSSAPAG